MEFSVCVEAVYNGKDFCESIRQVKKSGFSAIEFWSWTNKDIDSIIKTKEEQGVTVAAFCTKFVSLVDPGCHNEFLAGLGESIEIAKRLGCKTLIAQTGNDTGAPRDSQKAALIQGLKMCAPLLESNKITLAVEPLNLKVDHKGYYLYSSSEAFEIIDEVNSEYVKVLYDVYHQQITEGDIVRTIQNNISKIAHIHTAGHPGRHELFDGELNYEYIIKAIKDCGYNKFVGLEYFPKLAPETGLIYVASKLAF